MAPTETVRRPRLAPHVRMRFDASRACHVLLSPEAVWVLNEAGAAIVALCDGTRSVEEIQAELRERYDGVADGDVDRFVTTMVAQRRLEVDGG